MNFLLLPLHTKRNDKSSMVALPIFPDSFRVHHPPHLQVREVYDFGCFPAITERTSGFLASEKRFAHIQHTYINIFSVHILFYRSSAVPSFCSACDSPKLPPFSLVCGWVL